MIISNIDSILNTDFKIKKPFNYGSKTIFELYTGVNDLLYYQSPSMIVPYNYFINDNTFTLTLCEYKTTKYTDLINNVLKKLIKKAKTSYISLFENKVFNNPILCKPFNPKMFQFKNSKINDVEVYNIFQEKINLQDICVDDRVTCIYQIKNIWVNENSYGVNLNLIQLRRDNNINRGYIFIENKITNKNDYGTNNIDFSKYIMMIKAGIPILTVKNKMKNDNIKEINIIDFIDKHSKFDINSQIINHKNNILNKFKIENKKDNDKEKKIAISGLDFTELLEIRKNILNKNK